MSEPAPTLAKSPPQAAPKSGLRAALAAALDPLTLFATLAPKDPARRLAHNTAFGPGPHQRLDVYAPRRAPKEEGRPLPVALFFYGGSWDTGRRQDYNWVGRALAAQGFLTVVPDYGLYPEVRYPGFLEDGARAVRWAQDHSAGFGGDPERIVLVGHSAGAYNAAMIALDRRYLEGAGVEVGRIRALAGLSGPYDFLPLTDPIAIRTFGEAPDLPGTQPLGFVRPDAPPAFLATGDKDTIVYPRNTRKLATRLREVGVAVEERRYEGVDHVGMVLALSPLFRRRTPVLAEMTAFLRAKTA
jgi:acetyl esterase/lipase